MESVRMIGQQREPHAANNQDFVGFAEPTMKSLLHGTGVLMGF